MEQKMKDRYIHAVSVTDASAAAIQHLEYMAFGEVFVDERRTGFGTPYKFNAKELDCESGYYYYSARYYDPRMARFLSVDPLAGEFPSWTSYHYVHNNPLRYTDPTGMRAEDIIIPYDKEIYGTRDNWDAFKLEVKIALEKFSNDKYKVVGDQILIDSEGTNNKETDFSDNTNRIRGLIETNDKGTNTYVKKTDQGSYSEPAYLGAASDPAKGSDATVFWNPEKGGNVLLENGNYSRNSKTSLNHEMVHAFFTNRGMRLEGDSNVGVPEKVSSIYRGRTHLSNEELRTRIIENTEIRTPAKLPLRKIE